MQILFLIDIEAGPGPGPQFLQLRHVDGLGAFLALDDVELDFLAFFKGFETFSVYSCIMYEYIVSFRIADEAKTALVVESSDNTLAHVNTSEINM